jgi:hypothetical protein
MTVNTYQRQASLDRANQTKAEMVQLRNRIRAAGRDDGARLAAEAVLQATSSLRFAPLLTSIPGVGETASNRMLHVARISAAARVNSRFVDRRRRMLLADLLLGRAA